MPPILALALGIGLIVYLLRLDSRYGEKVTGTFWVFSIWFMILGSRPLTYWWGGGNFDVQVSTGTEGSPVNLISGLIFASFGLKTIIKRRINVNELFRQNSALCALLFYCLLSCIWSDYPLVSFRRWLRLMMNIVVVIAILSEPDRISVINKIFGKFAIFAIPLSIILIKYFPALAVGYDWSGEGKMWTGVCMHKNTLGATLSICILFILWKWVILKDYSSNKKNIFLIALASYIMFNPQVKGSSTAILSLSAAVMMLVCIKLFQRRIRTFAIFFYLLIGGYFVADIGVNLLFKTTILEYVTLKSGRDMTFTGRTVIWDGVLQEAAKSPIVGSGYGGFWTGARLQRLDSRRLMKGIKQSHNGYIETYANLGLIGLILLIITLFFALNSRVMKITSDYKYNSLSIAFIVQFVLGEFFEATVLSPTAFGWILLLIFIIRVPQNEQNIVALAVE